VVNTAQASPDDIVAEESAPAVKPNARLIVEPYSLVVLISQP